MENISEVKEKILRIIWEKGNRVATDEMSKEMGLTQRAVNIYLRTLRRESLITISGNGYLITVEGKKRLGFPEIDGEKAEKILRQTSPEDSFNFYMEIDQPLGVTSHTLIDFYEKIETIDTRSIEFHTSRGDFESWIHFLGDIELEERLRLIRNSDLKGEVLREKLYYTIKSRCDELLERVV